MSHAGSVHDDTINSPPLLRQRREQGGVGDGNRYLPTPFLMGGNRRGDDTTTIALLDISRGIAGVGV